MKSRFGPTRACAEFMLVAMHSSFRHGSRPRFKPTDSICTCCIIFRIDCSTRNITQPVVRHNSCQETAIVNARSVRSGIVLALSSATHAFESSSCVCAINNQKGRMKAKVNNLSIYAIPRPIRSPQLGAFEPCPADRGMGAAFLRQPDQTAGVGQTLIAGKPPLRLTSEQMPNGPGFVPHRDVAASRPLSAAAASQIHEILLEEALHSPGRGTSLIK